MNAPLPAENVIQFPERFSKNLMRHLNELFARMTAAGLTPEQQTDLLIQSAKDIGCVEIDGVWQMPPDTRSRDEG